MRSSEIVTSTSNHGANNAASSCSSKSPIDTALAAPEWCAPIFARLMPCATESRPPRFVRLARISISFCGSGKCGKAL